MLLIRTLLLALLFAAPAAAAELPDALPGWVIERTEQGYAELIEQVDAAVAASPLNVVTRASATVGAKSLGQDIRGNMVVGVFAPQFAIRLLQTSVAAGIEAPLRLYINRELGRERNAELQDRRARARALHGGGRPGAYRAGGGARHHSGADRRAGNPPAALARYG